MTQESDAIIRTTVDASLQRLAQSDADEYRSVMAFRTGSFEQYWLAKGKDAEERAEVEYERIERESDSTGGNSGEGGGVEPGDDHASVGGDSAPPSTEEGVSTPTGP